MAAADVLSQLFESYTGSARNGPDRQTAGIQYADLVAETAGSAADDQDGATAVQLSCTLNQHFAIDQRAGLQLLENHLFELLPALWDCILLAEGCLTPCRTVFYLAAQHCTAREVLLAVTSLVSQQKFRAWAVKDDMLLQILPQVMGRIKKQPLLSLQDTLTAVNSRLKAAKAYHAQSSLQATRGMSDPAEQQTDLQRHPAYQLSTFVEDLALSLSQAESLDDSACQHLSAFVLRVVNSVLMPEQSDDCSSLWADDPDATARLLQSLHACHTSTLIQLKSVQLASENGAAERELSEVQTGAALAVHFVLCEPQGKDILSMPAEMDLRLAIVAKAVTALVQTAYAHQSEGLCLRALATCEAGLADINPAAKKQIEGLLPDSTDLRHLANSIAQLASDNPVEAVRSTAQRSLQRLFSRMQAQAMLSVMQMLITQEQPAAAALCLHHLAHEAVHSWPTTTGGSERWQILCPALQPLILSRLQRGPASWTSPQDLPCLAEPICSALNLLRLLLLREQAAGTNHTGVRSADSRQQLEHALGPLQTAAKHSLDLLSREMQDDSAPQELLFADRMAAACLLELVGWVQEILASGDS